MYTLSTLDRICDKASERGAQVYEVMLDAKSPSATPEDIRMSATKLHAIGRILTGLSDDLWLMAQRIESEEKKYRD